MRKYTILIAAGIIPFLTFHCSPFFSFLLFVPVFYLFNDKKIMPKIGMIYIYFLLFNFITTYWLANVQIKEGLLTWGVNSLLMTAISILTFAVTKKENTRYLVFISLWLSFEVLHHLWVFNWPWLSLGNIFCINTKYIQWYKYTGIEGGTLWILFINFLIYKLSKSKEKRILIPLSFIVFIPLIISVILYKKQNNFKGTYSIIITQPNSNTLKDYQNELNLLNRVYDSVNVLKISTSAVLLLPETFIKESVLDNRPQDCRALQKITNKIEENKNIACITGLIIRQTNNEVINLTRNSTNLFNTYDAAIYLSDKYNPQLHFKSKLIPVEEYLPNFLKGLGFMSDNFSLGNHHTSFTINDNLDLSVAICYEIIFGHSIAQMVTEKTGAILMIANEQMLSGENEKEFYTNLSRLRAIENGKYLAKSSNTGFSGLINEKGETVFELEENKFGLQKLDVPINYEKTFYTKYFYHINILIILQGVLALCYCLFTKLKSAISKKNIII